MSSAPLLLLALAALAALGASTMTGARTPWRLRSAVAAAVVFCVSVVLLGSRIPANARLEAFERLQGANRPVEAPRGRYVSSRACRACHPGEHATWRASYHSKMTQLATPETVLAPFDGSRLVLGDRVYTVERRGDRFWVEMGALEGSSDAARVEREIVMTTGSHHFQAYWFATGKSRKLGLFPLCYQIAERRWIPMDALPVAPPDVEQTTLEGLGRWNGSCSTCHAVDSRPGIRGPDQMDTEVAEFGIACEACHGPGELHARLARDPRHRYRLYWTDATDETIVNPARLDHRRSAQVCGQCHSVHVSATVEEGRRRTGTAGPSFRPGDDLHASRLMQHENLPAGPVIVTHFWSDGFVRVNGREYNSLLGTACFQRGELTCSTCHQMHQQAGDPRDVQTWADDQLLPAMRGNDVCLQCHAALGDEESLVGHTGHEPDSSGSVCYNCHMPNTAYGLHKATRNHQIDSPMVSPEGVAARPNACNLCHLDKTLAWTARELEGRYEIPAPVLSNTERSVAAGALWALSGDAGQRALAVWHMDWPPAREVSHASWMAPYLAQLLADPYAAVRMTAFRSLRGIEGFEDFRYDVTASRDEWRRARQLAFMRWQQLKHGQEGVDLAAVLLKPGHRLNLAKFNRLLGERDDRPIYLAE